MERNKLRLTNTTSQRAVNQDLYDKIQLSQDAKPLPYNDIVRVISENDQFNKERRESTRYRLVGSVNSLFSNVLFNATGEKSWATFNTPLFRDRSYPPNGISLNEEEDFTLEESIAYHLKEKGGWLGYNNPNINEFNDHSFTHMEPSKDKFDLVTLTGENNWGVTMTYPAKKLTNPLTQGGLDIISLKSVTVGGKKMTAVGIPYKHNLNLKDDVKLTNIKKDGIYQVMRLGLDNGDFKDNYFVIDIDITALENKGGKFKKIYYGEECEYYFRVFKRVNNQDGLAMSDKDLDCYPLAFSKNVYNDSIVQLATKKDIDLNGLVDNLGRPVTEMFLTFIKNNNKGFSSIKSGLLINNIDGLETFRDIPDIKRIHNGVDAPFKSNKALNESVSFSDGEFIGDLVEYNKGLLLETVLAEVRHRFNTTNREKGGAIKVIESPIVIIDRDKIDHSWNPPFVIEDHGLNLTYVDSDGNNRFNEEPISGFQDTFSMKQAVENQNIEVLGGTGTFSYTPKILTYSTTPGGACSSNLEKTFYLNATTLKLATKVYSDSWGGATAKASSYSDGATERFWDGTKFTSLNDCGADTCTGKRATIMSQKPQERGIFLGGSCFQTDVDSDGTEYFLSGDGYYQDIYASGSNTSCSYSILLSGSPVDNFIYNGTTISADNNSEIRLIRSDYLFNGKTYDVYVKWHNKNDERLLYMDDPYMVCKETSTPITETETNINLGGRQEGYYYKPFNRIQLRSFSNYIEEGDEFTEGIPDYAEKLEDGRYIWRDLLDVGILERGMDYPFINGTHYLHDNFTLALRRQDPFNEYGLYYKGAVPDLGGVKMSNNKKINKSGDVC